MRNGRSLAPLLASLFTAACAAPDRRPVEPLPFHVAMIPAEVEEVPDALPAGEDEDDVIDFRLELQEAAVSRAFGEFLDGYCFARTTLLEPPADGEGDGLLTRNDHWVREAQRVGADLLLEARLAYDPAVRTSTNEKFWLNVPLFLLGGPMVWFVDDRSYLVQTNLSVRLYDVPPMSLERAVEARATLTNGNSELLHIDVDHTEASFDFIDRAGGDVGDYALSFLIPAGFVATDNEHVQAHLQQDVVAGLAARLVDRVQDRKLDLLRPERHVHFWPEGFQVAQGPQGGRQLSGDVVLRTDEIARMDAYQVVFPGHGAREQPFDRGEEEERGGRRYRRYAIREDVPAGLMDGMIRIRLFDAYDNERTLTVPVGGTRSIGQPVEAVYRPDDARAVDA